MQTTGERKDIGKELERDRKDVGEDREEKTGNGGRCATLHTRRCRRVDGGRFSHFFPAFFIVAGRRAASTVASKRATTATAALSPRTAFAWVFCGRP